MLALGKAISQSHIGCEWVIRLNGAIWLDCKYFAAGTKLSWHPTSLFSWRLGSAQLDHRQEHISSCHRLCAYGPSLRTVVWYQMIVNCAFLAMDKEKEFQEKPFNEEFEHSCTHQKAQESHSMACVSKTVLGFWRLVSESAACGIRFHLIAIVSWLNVSECINV